MYWLVVPLVVVVFLSAYTLGRFHERTAQAEAAERMRRIDPGRRTPGLPTNLSGEPSKVRRARMRR